MFQLSRVESESGLLKCETTVWSEIVWFFMLVPLGLTLKVAVVKILLRVCMYFHSISPYSPFAAAYYSILPL